MLRIVRIPGSDVADKNAPERDGAPTPPCEEAIKFEVASRLVILSQTSGLNYDLDFWRDQIQNRWDGDE